MIKKTIAAALMALTVVVSAATSTGVAEAAQSGEGGGANESCSNVYSYSHPSAGKLRITFTAKCVGPTSAPAYGVMHAITVTRNGGHTVVANVECFGKTKCSGSKTVDDPGGTQKFTATDELYVLWSPGAWCQPAMQVCFGEYRRYSIYWANISS